MTLTALFRLPASFHRRSKATEDEKKRAAIAARFIINALLAQVDNYFLARDGFSVAGTKCLTASLIFSSIDSVACLVALLICS